MAITVYGTGPTIDQLWWSRLHQYEVDALASSGVRFGLAVTPGTGRTVNVALGRWFAAGVVGDMTTDVTNLAVAANGTSFNRVDIVCAKIDWATNAGSIVVVQGPTPTNLEEIPPSLTALNTAGSVWYVPLAYVTILPGATSFTSARIIDARFFGYDRTLHGTDTVTSGGTKMVFFDRQGGPSRFTSAPAVTVTPYTGAGSSTTSNLNISVVGLDYFVVTLNRSTATSVEFAWIAAGR